MNSRIFSETRKIWGVGAMGWLVPAVYRSIDRLASPSANLKRIEWIQAPGHFEIKQNPQSS
jgi:hypothetical protein